MNFSAPSQVTSSPPSVPQQTRTKRDTDNTNTAPNEALAPERGHDKPQLNQHIIIKDRMYDQKLLHLLLRQRLLHLLEQRRLLLLQQRQLYLRWRELEQLRAPLSQILQPLPQEKVEELEAVGRQLCLQWVKLWLQERQLRRDVAAAAAAA